MPTRGNSYPENSHRIKELSIHFNNYEIHRAYGFFNNLPIKSVQELSKTANFQYIFVDKNSLDYILENTGNEEDVNHVLSLGRQRSLTGLQGCGDLGVRGINHVIGDHGAEGDGAHAHTGLAKEVAAGGGRREAVIAVLDFHRGGIYMFSVKGGWG